MHCNLRQHMKRDKTPGNKQHIIFVTNTLSKRNVFEVAQKTTEALKKAGHVFFCICIPFLYLVFRVCGSCTVNLMNAFNVCLIDSPLDF